MRVVHRVGVADGPGRSDTLLSLGVPFRGPDSVLAPVIAFDIDESHPAWVRLAPLLAQWGASDIVRTAFSLAEHDGAERSQICPAWHQSYPQPEDGFGYLSQPTILRAIAQRVGSG